MADQLEITVLHARGLPQSQLLGSQTPYAHVVFNEMEWSSKGHKGGGANAIINDKCTFPLSPSTRHFHIRMKRKGGKEAIGVARVSLEEALGNPNHKVPTLVRLMNPVNEYAAGEVEIFIRIIKADSSATQPYSNSNGYPQPIQPTNPAQPDRYPPVTPPYAEPSNPYPQPAPFGGGSNPYPRPFVSPPAQPDAPPVLPNTNSAYPIIHHHQQPFVNASAPPLPSAEPQQGAPGGGNAYPTPLASGVDQFPLPTQPGAPPRPMGGGPPPLHPSQQAYPDMPPAGIPASVSYPGAHAPAQRHNILHSPDVNVPNYHVSSPALPYGSQEAHSHSPAPYSQGPGPSYPQPWGGSAGNGFPSAPSNSTAWPQGTPGHGPAPPGYPDPHAANGYGPTAHGAYPTPGTGSQSHPPQQQAKPPPGYPTF